MNVQNLTIQVVFLKIRDSNITMISIEEIVKFNAQTAGREKLIRLCQYTTRFVRAILQIYRVQFGKGGIQLLDFIYKLGELEKYFISCRRLLCFGCCTDQFYSALRAIRIYDPIVRTTLAASKFTLSFQMFADHILWLQQLGILVVDRPRWAERFNQFWLYSISINLMRDFYELICVIQARRSREKDNLDDGLKKFSLSTPLKWARNHPKLSCDLIKNFCDFWIPYSAINQIDVHPAILSSLGIISSTLGILQVYDSNYRLTPS